MLLSRAHQLQLLSVTHTKGSLMEQQKNVWKHEFVRLRTAETKTYGEICSQLVTLAIQYDATGDLQSCLELSKRLDEELNHFADLLFLTHEDFAGIWNSLQNEEGEVEMALKNAKWESGKNREVPSKVPEDFMELCFPDMTMKQALLDELWALDDKYQARLSELDDNFRKHKSPGWNENDTAIFSHVVNMFPPELTNRKVLWIDFLKHLFPQRTLAELEAHRTWREKNRFYNDQRGKTVDDWNRERWVWLMLSKSICTDELQKHESLYHRKETIVHQRDLCFNLRKKVDQWRNDKAMEDKMLEELQSHWLVVLRKVQAERTKAESVRRQVDKQKLLGFYQFQLETKRQKEIKREQELDKIKMMSRKRLTLNRERVSHRLQVSVEQQLARQRKLEEQRENRKKEPGTLAFRDVKRDVTRVQPTTSFLSKRRSDDSLPEIQRMFQIHTYTDEQVAKDLRIQTERREASLLHNDHSFRALKAIVPPTQPRRDTFSVISLADM